MDIKLDMYLPFMAAFNEMKEKYGDDFLSLNGFANRNLNFTDFINNFVDSDNVANATIDANANASMKDICSLLSEIDKPHTKLLAYNKIFYELTKKYGLQTAKDWLENEWNGAYYLHDAYSASFKPYCFTGDTKFMTKEGIKRLDEMVGKDVMVLNKNHGWEHGVVHDFGEATIWELLLERYGVVKKIRCTGNHRWLVKKKRGRTLDRYTTEQLKEGMVIPFNTSIGVNYVPPSPFGIAHGFYIGDGSKGSSNKITFCGDKNALLPYFTPDSVCESENGPSIYTAPNFFKELPSLTESPSYLYGFIVGYFAADGCIDEKCRCVLTSVNRSYLEFVRNVLCILGMPVNEIREQERVSNLTNELGNVYFLTLTSEYLTEEFFIRPSQKERFVKLERKNRGWTVKSVVCTDNVEEVYCVTTDYTHTFTLDNNILTGNCFAYDLEDLVNKGLYFVKDFNSEAPKHLLTYVRDCLEFVSWTSNRTSGACGLPNFLIYFFYFWKKDVEAGYYLKSPEYYMHQGFQEIIYGLNQPYLRVNQSAFTNFTIMDRPYLEEIFGGKEFPSALTTKSGNKSVYMIDFVEDLIEIEKEFMEEVSLTREKTMFTFPVLTYSLLYRDGKFVDYEFARWCNKHNMKWADSNFFVSGDVTSLSSCCFDGNQKVLIKDCDDIIHYDTFKNIANSKYISKGIKIYYNGFWANGTLVSPLNNKKMYKITTENNKIVYVTYDHIFPTNHGDKKAYELTTDDYLKFNTSSLEGSMIKKEYNTEYNESILDSSLSFRTEYINKLFENNTAFINNDKLVETVEFVANSIGLNTKIEKTDNGYIVTIVDSDYFRITSIEDYKSDDSNVYCFAMDNEDEPYFTLPNGMITHNCRLVNDFSKLKGFINSIGGTALKIGSVKVNTINLARIALETNSKEEYLDKLTERTNLCIKVLDVIRSIIKRDIEKGLLPNYTYGLIDLNRQYNTVGINGMYEAVNRFDGIRKDEFGNEYYTDDGLKFASDILDKINEIKDSYDFDYSINVEAVPKMCGHLVG